MCQLYIRLKKFQKTLRVSKTPLRFDNLLEQLPEASKELYMYNDSFMMKYTTQ